MPIWFGPVPGKKLFHVVYSGVIGLHDILGFFDRFEADFRAYPEHDEFCDARDVTRVDLSRRELDAILSLVIGIYRRNDCRKRIAFLAPDGDAAAALQRATDRFQAELPVVKCRQLGTSEAALEFVDLPSDFVLRRALH